MKTSKRTFLLAFLFVILHACEDPINEPRIARQLGTNITASRAVEIAQAKYEFIEYTANFGDNARVSSDTRNGSNLGKTVKAVKTVKGKEGRNAIHVINYDGGGWALVAGDTRLGNHSVLAYSEDGDFDYDDLKDKNGIGNFLNAKIRQVEAIQESAIMPEDLEIVPYIIDPPGDECDPVNNTVFLYQSKWDQTTNNDDFPSGSGCSHKPAGCVPVAIVSIAAYMDAPNYDWGSNSCIANPNSTNCTSAQIQDIEAALWAVYASGDWGKKVSNCTRTGMYTLSETEQLWQGLVGSSGSVSWSSNVSFSTIMNSINDDRPLMIDGSASSPFIWEEAHAWTITGYKHVRVCPSNQEFNDVYYCWGWYTNGNGWYDHGDTDHTGGAGDFKYFDHLYSFEL